MRLINLIGMMLVLYQLAIPVSAGSISSSAPHDLSGIIFRNGVPLDDVKVRVKVKKICSLPHWQTSIWSYPHPYEGYYGTPLFDEGYYTASVSIFKFGNTYKSCLKSFYFDGETSINIDFDIYSLDQIPLNCGGTYLPC